MSSTNSRLREFETAFKLIDKILERTLSVGDDDSRKMKEIIEQVQAVVNSTKPELPHAPRIKKKNNKKEKKMDIEENEADDNNEVYRP
jgi:hypothetical protein